jgi:hypothetical protein
LFDKSNLKFGIFRYDENGNCHGKVEVIPPTPTRIQWDFDEPLLKTIDEAYLDAQKVLNVRQSTKTKNNSNHSIIFRTLIFVSLFMMHMVKVS